MHELLNQIAKCTDTGEFYLALFTSLAVPDICGAMESSNGKATRNKYISWFDRYVSPKYVFLTGEICYSFRCAVLHQGRTQKIDSSHPRIFFYNPLSCGHNLSHDNLVNGNVNIDIRMFSYDIVRSARSWLVDMQSNTNFHAHYPHFLQYRGDGVYT